MDKKLGRLRYLCPFYGFSFIPKLSLMVGHPGNRCALITDAHSPCRMEVQELIPCWERCTSFNKLEMKNDLESISENTRVFPEKVLCEGEEYSKGISFKEWLDYLSVPLFPPLILNK